MKPIQTIEQVASEAIAAINQAKAKAIAKINTDTTPKPKHNLNQSVVVAGINWSAHLTPSEYCDAPSMFNETTGVHYFDQKSAVLHAFEQNMRLPTETEIKQLYDRTTQHFETIGVNTYCVFIDKETKAELWMVFSGWYDFEDGAFYLVGGLGYCWSSSVYSSSHGYSLNFKYGGINPQNNSDRRYGFPVRCVQQ